MIKLYVEAINFLHRSTETLFNKDKEEGFASAETIALAVAGVVVAGLALGFFRTKIEGWIDNITGEIDSF